MVEKKVRLLLVEGDAAHGEWVRHAFESNNQSVDMSVVMTLQKARAILQKSVPDIVIVDDCLPDGKGIELLPTDKKVLRYPIIILTDSGDELSVPKSIETGVFYCLSKSPESRSELPHVCERLLREWDNFPTQKKTNQLPHGLEEEYLTLFDTASEAMMVTDIEQNILCVNAAFTEMTHYGASEVIGKNPKILQSGRHNPAFYREMWGTLKTAEHWEGEVWNRRKDGALFVAWLSIAPVKNGCGKTVRYTGLFSDITQQKQGNKKTSFQPHHDPLTGLLSRTLLIKRLSQTIEEVRRSQKSAALFLVDLDHFKEINHTHGYIAGDTILKEAAERILKAVRKTDTVSRVGSDEFLVILSEISEKKSVISLAEKVINRLSKFQIDGHDISLGASIGITIAPDDGETSENLLQNVETALSKSKEKGPNHFCFFSEKMEMLSKERTVLEWDLRRALVNQELLLYYQPIVDLISLKTVALEALIRWKHPRQGLLLPEQFIPIAENSELISEIGEWVLSTACKQMKQWQIRYGLDMAVSVNLSSREFKYAELSLSLSRALEKSGLDSSSLILEIAESIMLDPTGGAIRKLQSLKDVGVKILIDDFGIGYASLNYLSQYPIDLLKVDKSFIKDIATDPRKKTLVETIIRIGQSMKMKIIAEGAEFQEDLSCLKQLGCNAAQGHFFTKPLSVENYEKVLENLV